MTQVGDTPPPATSHYDAASRLFHWATAVVATVAFVLGPEHFGRLMRDGLDPATRLDIVWHESLGVLVFVLTAARLAWTAVRPSPPRVGMVPWMSLAGRVLHLALWALLLLLPATALLALGGEGHPLTLLGGIRIDRMVPIAQSPVAGLADWGEVHKLLGDALMALAALHAAAALFHHVVLKDGVLLGMLRSR